MRAAAPALRLKVGDLDFDVRTSDRRRTIGITVDRDGSLVIDAPSDCSRSQLTEFAHEKRMWVYTKLAEKDLLLSPRPAKEFVTGEGFAYLGRSYRLQLVDRLDAPVKLETGRLKVQRRLTKTGEGRTTVIGWYQRTGAAWLQRRVPPWAARMGVDVSTIDVRDLGYRWGSLGSGGRLNIHWATLQLSPGLVDYVIAHELAHAGEPNHTPAFWRILARTMPDFERRKGDLATRGSLLWLGD